MRNRTLTLTVERLPDRIVPTTALFSNGVLDVQGDNAGNRIAVGAFGDTTIVVYERGQSVPIVSQSGVVVTTANLKHLVEDAGSGNGNILTTNTTLPGIPVTFLGAGAGINVFAPGSNAPAFAVGSPDPRAGNLFTSNPGGRDTFVGGAGTNVFFWPPGTGSNRYVGAGRSNTVLIVGNNNGTAEQDTLLADGRGGVTYSRLGAPQPFALYMTGIGTIIDRPSTGPGNNVVVGDQSGTPTRSVEVDAFASTIDARAQRSRAVTLTVNGTLDTVLPGAGPTVVSHAPLLTPLQLLYQARRRY